MPRSNSNRRIWFTTAVRRMMKGLHIQLLVGLDWDEAQRGLETASAIAAASMKSFLLVFTNGFMTGDN